MADATIDLHGEPPFRGLQFSVAVVSGASRGALDLSPRDLVVCSGAAAALRLDDDSVSKRPVTLPVQGAAVRVRDLASRNGTWVGAYRVTDTLVPPGTVVRVGRTSLHLRSADPVPDLEPSANDRFGDLRGGSL